MQIFKNTLIQALGNMFGKDIIEADYQKTELQGGTVGDVLLVIGIAESTKDEKLPYKIVMKKTNTWERKNDPDSWRREYDLYKSDFDTLFSSSFRWAKCYHAEINEEENETQIWMEYIDGISGLELTGDMYERAAEELGRFQGKLYAEKPDVLQNLTNLSEVEFSKKFYLHYRSWKEVYEYIRANDCEIPKHLCKMLIEIDETESEVWSRIERLPIVLCHRDFWVTNIFYANGTEESERSKNERSARIVLIDWDTTGWGYFGEDLASLIADEADVEHMLEYYQRCVPAYYKGFSEYVDISHITDNCVRELILVMFGYRLVEWYKFAKSPDEKTLHLNTLQKIYEMENCT